MPGLFDSSLRSMRRERALRIGPETFLHDRAFDDIIDRLDLIDRKFGRVLLSGALNPDWHARLAERAATVETIDPARSLAGACGGQEASEDTLDVEPGTYDLVVSIGTLDTIEALPESLARLRFALREGGLLIGAMSGGDTLPLLRECMAQADTVTGHAAPHVHPRIDPASLTQLLSNAGLAMPVVDVDSVTVRYSSFDRLINDLRAMGATNILSERPRKALSRAACAAAKSQFNARAASDGKSEERFDILHFMGWSPASTENRG